MPECGRGCAYWPPSAKDGKPCSVCDTSEPYLNCFQPKTKDKQRKGYEHTYHIRLNTEHRRRLKVMAAQRGLSEAAMLKELVMKAFERS